MDATRPEMQDIAANVATLKSEAGNADKSDVAMASERLDSALEMLTRNAGLVEDRVHNYLSPPVDRAMLAHAELPREPVPAAAEITRQATAVENVADRLSELLERFQG